MSVPPDLAESAPTSNTSEPETLPEASLEHSFPNSRELAQLIQQRVWLHVRRRKAWLDSLPTRATQQDASEFFNDPDDPRLERQWQNNGEGRIWNEPIREIDMELSGPAGNPLRLLAATFALSRPELDVIQTCVAQQLDPALGPVFAYLHGQGQSACVSGPLAKRCRAIQRVWQRIRCWCRGSRADWCSILRLPGSSDRCRSIPRWIAGLWERPRM